MQKNTKCTKCGKLFDVDIVRAAFNERYVGMFDYDERGDERVCYACACLMADRGRWCAESDADSGGSASADARPTCRRCQRKYDLNNAKTLLEYSKDRFRQVGRTPYTEKVDGLCAWCAMVVMLGYDTREF